MIHIIIAACGEVNSTERAINAFLKQNIKEEFEIIVSDPFTETKWMIEEKFPDNKRIRYFEDPGKGKSNALNLIFKEIWSNDKDNIIISTDADVYVSENSVNAILSEFKKAHIGCVSGRPVSTNYRNNMYGYWSHFLCDVGAHEISRKRRYHKGQFLETSGYLFAFRNGIIKEIPTDVAEDTIIPYRIYNQGYMIGYAEDAKVYVKWPTNMKDWMKQKKRAADAHTKLTKYVKDFPKVKSFIGEILGGLIGFGRIFSYPKNFKEFLWTLNLFPTRLIMWLSLYYDLHFKKREYSDGWRENLEVESTRTLD
ncbi:glycosyltransferase [Candidatus Woesearchaeota archaeon]|nr:glycosyltransferase [Candidatus Woesearchaeota archaeon]